jgi:DNA-binding transcriptional MocR family regulator
LPTSTFGAFTKTLFPSLPSGYVVLPDWLVAGFQGAMSATARYPEPLMRIGGLFSRSV